MRKIIVTFLLLASGLQLAGQSLQIAFEALEERLGKQNAPQYFYNGHAYTGKTTDRYEPEEKIIEYSFIDGYIQQQLGWDFDGNKVRHFEYRNGVPNGKLTSYFSNGQKYYEADYVDGKAHGMEYGWYRDGRKRLEVRYVNGQPLYKIEYPEPK